jgi:hypothetical protein
MLFCNTQIIYIDGIHLSHALSDNDRVNLKIKRKTRYRLNLTKADLKKNSVDELINDLLDLLEFSKSVSIY